MAVHITKTIVCQAPVQQAFAYTANYRNIPQWLFGIKEFRPVGDLDYGLGSVFDGEMHLGATLTSRVEVIEFDENRKMVLDSVSGFKNTSSWTFNGNGDRTEIAADVTYVLPGGIAGKALGKLIAPFIQVAVNKSAEHLVEHIEKTTEG